MRTPLALDSLSPLDKARLLGELQADVMRDKSYQLTPLGMEAAAYLRHKRKRLTKGSYRKYESALDKLARRFPHREVSDFEPPVGTTRIEEFMDEQWGPGTHEPRTYNSNLSILKDFFKWLVATGQLRADPTLAIDRAKARDPHREVFTGDQLRAIIAAQEELRDRIALRLLLTYGLRKGELRACRFKHFDHVRKTLTVMGKGGTVTPVPIPEPAFWHDLERLILDAQAEPSHYLMPGRRGNRHGSKLLPETPISNHALHDWWYACLTRAGVVPEGTTSGERMHKARHTSGQRLLDSTGNLKAVQRLLRHSSLITTADTYLDWDLDQLTRSLVESLEREEREGE